MATSPGFANVPRVGSALPATFDTSLTAPTTALSVFAAGASGSRIDEVRFQAVGTTVAGVVNLFAHDGTTYHLIDQVTTTAITSSTTVAAWQAVRQYQNLVLANGWSLRASVTVAGLNSIIKVSAFGADF